MKSIIASLLVLLCIEAFSQNEYTYFAPLFGKVQLDTSEWILPRYEPFAMYYYLNQGDYSKNFGNLVHKNSGLKVFFRNEYNYKKHYYTTDFLRRIWSGNVSEKSFHEKFITYVYDWRNEVALVSEIEEGIFFVVSTNTRLMDTLQVKALEDLMSNLSVIQPSEIDKLMGYPIKVKESQKAFRDRLINEFVGNKLVSKNATHHENLTANPLDTVWFDEYYFLEKKFNFSFQKTFETRRHDIKRDFTQEEYLTILFGDQRENPTSITNVPRFVGEMRSQEKFFVNQYFAEDYSKAAKLPVVYNEFSTDIEGYVLLCNDSAWNLVYAEKGKDKSGVLKWMAYNHTGKRSYTSGTGAKGQLLNPNYYESVYFEIPDDGVENYVITSYANKKNESGIRYQTTPVVSVINSNHKKQKFTKFSTPATIGTYKVVMLVDFEGMEFLSLGDQGFDYDHADWAHYYPDTLGVVRRKLLFTSNLVSKNYQDVYQLENKIATYPMNQRIVISPVLEADLDNDGNREVFRVFVSNGSIINYEIFENSKSGLVKVELTDVWKKKVRNHHYVSRIVVLSKDQRFYSPYEELRVDQIYMDGFEGEYFAPVEAIHDTPALPAEEEIFTFAEIPPVYPGGQEAMMADINASIVYPEMEKENGIGGTVYMGFVVEKDGSITNVQVKRGISGGPGLTKAAENAVKKLKKFETPAKSNGRPIRYQYTLPVKFVMQ